MIHVLGIEPQSHNQKSAVFTTRSRDRNILGNINRNSNVKLVNVIVIENIFRYHESLVYMAFREL